MKTTTLLAATAAHHAPPALRPSRALAAAAAALALLAGCASTAPPPLAAAEPAAPPAWQAPLPAAAVDDAARWWDRFDDVALPPLIGAAQQASPTLASAAARIERARATRILAGAQRLPLIDAVGGLSHGRAQPGFPTATTASAGLQASWEIDLFGALAAGQQAALAREAGAQAGWHDARIAIAAEVATSYVGLRACEAQLVQVQFDADSRQTTARLTDETARVGFTAPADAALARAGAAQARSQAASQRAACDTLVKSLVELTDLPEPALRARLAAGTARLPEPPPLGVRVLPAQLLAQRPDLVAAERNVAAAAADRSVARAREFPRVTLGGAFSAVSIRSGGVTDSGSTWSIGPLSVSLPVFDLGARVAATSAARAEYDAAVAAYGAALRRAVREVEAALVTLDATAARAADARLAVDGFNAAATATEARQRGGLASLLDLENARRNAVQAQRDLIELQRERTAAWITLYRALGGGWDTALAPATTTASTTPSTP